MIKRLIGLIGSLFLVLLLQTLPNAHASNLQPTHTTNPIKPLSPSTPTAPTTRNIAMLNETLPKDRDLLEYELMMQGGFIDLDITSFGDNSKAHPYSNLNHGLMLGLFFPENLLPAPFGASMYFQGKYMTFSESIDKRFPSAKFVDLDYGLNLMITLISSLRLDCFLGISSNPILIRRTNQDFKIMNYPSPTLGTRLNYSLPLSEQWTLSLLVSQYFLGSAMVSGVKVKDGLGIGAGFQFNLDLNEDSFAFIGYTGTSDSQASKQANIKRNEDLLFLGISEILN